MAQVRLARVIPIHACALVCCVVVDFSSPVSVLYFVPPLSFQPFQMFTSVFNEKFRSNPLCDFRLGTVATSDHETPLTRYGKKEGDQEYHTANQLHKKCKKRQFLSIRFRFIRDAWFRKTMIELCRTEEVIREMDKLANEDHTRIATEEELNVYRSNWWIRSNFVGSDTIPIRHRSLLSPTGGVKSIPPTTENWLRKRYNYSMKNETRALRTSMRQTTSTTSTMT